ncbi:MAG TPA: nitrous oxide reductase accessory protein NosL [Azospirillum sp.]|nr:nitrous oxide reductase accessory protein NosL [Azospirillum sp.]
MRRRQFLFTASAIVPMAALISMARAAEGDGTPMQFMPKAPKDPKPLERELEKYPKCPYCGMDRRQWHHSRHLIHYSDDLVDGTCSLHCAAVGLALNLDRGPQAIYAADFGATAEPKPLVNVDTAAYLLGSTLPPTMSKVSNMVFSSKEAAERAQKDAGGTIVGFDQALAAAYTGMAEDTVMIRKRRAERRAKASQQGH